MPIVQSYLRYAPSGASCGVVYAAGAGDAGSSAASALAFAHPASKSSASHVVLCPALENVIAWDIRKGQQEYMLQSDGKHAATCVARSPDQRHIAVGYSDGAIRLWNSATRTVAVAFNGHSAAVTVLRFDAQGALLYSGSRDTDVIVWDIVAETGLYRLKGHKDAITDIRLLPKHKLLLTSSRDSLIKVWDSTQSCVDTIVGHRAEVWSMAVDDDETMLITGTSDPELRVWSIRPVEAATSASSAFSLGSGKLADLKKIANITGIEFHLDGVIRRQSTDRACALTILSEARVLACHNGDRTVEFYRIRTVEDVSKRAAKRIAKQQQQQQQQTEGQEMAVDEPSSTTPADRIILCHVLRTGAKVRGLDLQVQSVGVPSAAEAADDASNKKKKAKKSDKLAAVKLLAAVGLADNSVELFSLDLGTNSAEEVKIASVERAGHRSDIRSLALSSDESLILSTSNNELKIWNRVTKACLRTIECGYGLCSLFVPGNRHVIVGTKTGELQLFDIASGVMLENVKAHEGAVWSICLRPDRRGFVSGSADHDVKFWEFELVTEQVPMEEGSQHVQAQRRLTFTHEKTLKMTEDVLAVTYSPNQQLLAVSLLDCTVKVFYADSLKFFLSMYGHKLPVLAMDISSDNALLVTASADKNVKIWGLDYGDCHRSLFAHADSVMSVRFVPETHYFFSVSKDKTLRYWDADRFEHIASLEGHHSEVWCLAVSKTGHFIVTGSHDRSIRVWERTEQQLFVEEEREREREQEYENAAVESRERAANAGLSVPGQEGSADDENGAGDASQAGPSAGGASAGSAALAGKRTMETIRSGEQLIEALEIAIDEKAKEDAYLQQFHAYEQMREQLQKEQDEIEQAQQQQKQQLEALEASGAKGKRGAGKNSKSRDVSEYEQSILAAEATTAAAAALAVRVAAAAATAAPRPPAKHPMLMAYGNLSHYDYVLQVLHRIRASDLEATLLLLSFSHVSHLLEYIEYFVRNGKSIELCLRCELFLMRLYQNQIVAAPALLSTVESLHQHTRSRITEQKNIIGFNMAALKFMKRDLESQASMKLFSDVPIKLQAIRKKKKKAIKS
ncbi:WD repeat domain-containing protein [Capsaspora owczarzaki ATCC 30864]|nr:WD repeat domain-containing protein [Capsaspora owczarzaki ATCC 30864]|eukprot:XP_004363419.1 WD repeat domain-containing protein [Capsaspora owczarzaki ATCC 30864]